MRLAPEEVEAIKKCCVAVFGADADVRLFGSRADDCRKGGDIDLHIEASQASLAAEARFQSLLRGALGDRKVDVVILVRGSEPRPIDRIALRTGVAL
ncbi:MAG: nucleotidyltransferase domain-containing protein [Pseudomonadota bacterium]